MSLVEKYPLQKRKILKKSALSSSRALFASFVILSIILFLVWLGADRDSDKVYELTTEFKPFIFLLLTGLTIWVLSAPIYELLYFLNYYYNFDDNNIIIRKGIIAKREITLPFSKITDVYVDQDIADVILGLYDIHISTPTIESGKFAHIDGINKKGATEIKKIILERVHSYSIPTQKSELKKPSENPTTPEELLSELEGEKEII